MRAKAAVVVDTNVPVTANGDADHASSACREACCEQLLGITRGRARLRLDDRFQILDEYFSKLSLSGQPGVGDLFVKWAHDHQFNPERCERVTLTSHSSRGYEEFPDDEDLSAFDRDDRKFAAAARVGQVHARVLNAVDSDWWEYERVLARYGIHVEFVCGDQVVLWEEERRQR